MMAYLVVSGTFLTYLRRPMGSMTAQEQKLEGEFRYINSRLITNSEEIAFYNGNTREKLTMLVSFKKLVSSFFFKDFPLKTLFELHYFFVYVVKIPILYVLFYFLDRSSTEVLRIPCSCWCC